MGWTGQHSTLSPAEHVVRDLTDKARIVATATRREGRGHVVFVAYRTDAHGVVALVTLVERRSDGLMWTKYMDESMGPYHSAKCPKNIMALLSPTPPTEWAAAWRARQQ